MTKEENRTSGRPRRPISNGMKSILIFSTAYLPFVGGAEIAVKEITDRLGEHYTFDLITARMDPTLPRLEQIGKVAVHRVGLGMELLDKLLLPGLGAIVALRLHREKHYDIFWGIMVTFASLIPLKLKFLSPRPCIPFVLTLQEGDSERHLRWRWGGLINIAWKLLLNRAQFVTAISAHLLARARMSGYEGRAEIIPNGVSVKHFSQTYSEEELSKAREELGKKEGDIFLVTTGRLVKKNAVDDVIRALALLPKRVHFVIFGAGPDEEKLKSLARKEGVEGRTHFQGHIDHKVMPFYLKVCDTFIRPSRSEGMGNSFVEAMAVGLPVIATQVGGIADFLFDGKRNPDKEVTGWAVDRDSPEQIAKAVKDIIKHPGRVEKVKQTAKTLVFEKYDWDIIARDMHEKVFAKVLK